MADRIVRGDIWLYRFAPPDKRRPVLILSRNSLLEVVQTATVAPITSTSHGAPVEVQLGTEQGLKSDSWANLANIVTVRRTDLVRWVGSVSPQVMKEICRALNIAVGCDLA